MRKARESRVGVIGSSQEVGEDFMEDFEPEPCGKSKLEKGGKLILMAGAEVWVAERLGQQWLGPGRAALEHKAGVRKGQKWRPCMCWEAHSLLGSRVILPENDTWEVFHASPR